MSLRAFETKNSLAPGICFTCWLFHPVSDISLLFLSLALLEKCVLKCPIYSTLADFQFTQWDAESHEEVRSWLCSGLNT